MNFKYNLNSDDSQISSLISFLSFRLVYPIVYIFKMASPLQWHLKLDLAIKRIPDVPTSLLVPLKVFSVLASGIMSHSFAQAKMLE